MNAVKHDSISIDRAEASAPILLTASRTAVAIRAGTVIRVDGHPFAFEAETPVDFGDLVPGTDYALALDTAGTPLLAPAGTSNPLVGGAFAGFHYAPGGNAEGTEGGDDTPAINPFSIWDVGFRPSCPDPRGMSLVEVGGRRIWIDIYLLGVEHLKGTSRAGVTIADGNDRPERADGKGKHAKLDYQTAVEVYAYHGKRLLGAEEFFAAAYGVKERCARGEDAKVTGSLSEDSKRFISRFGLFDITGTMWQWGTDGHPDDPHPSIFGGSWLDGSDAGSRYADVGYYWPAYSDGHLSARGACDHLHPA